MSPLITVLTSVYNAMPYLPDCFESVIQQSYRPIEYIIFDDGSTDGSLAYIRSYLPVFEKNGIRTTVIEAEQNAGQANAFCRMLPHIHGESFTWIDADDFFEKDCLAHMAAYLSSHPEYAFARGSYRVIADDPGAIPPKTVHIMDRPGDIFEGVWRGVDYALSGAYMMRTKPFFECYPDGRFPLSREGQNFQMILPIASRSECGFLDETVFCYRVHSDSHSQRKRSMRELLSRNEQFYQLKLALLPYCRVDVERYAQIAKDVRDQTEKDILRSAAIRARTGLKK